MKKLIGCLVLLVMLFGVAAADQTVSLPGDHYSLSIPDNMEYSPKNPRDAEQSVYFQFAYFSTKLGLEMDVFAYPNGGVSLKQLAEAMKEKDQQVEIRRISGIDMLVYRGEDEADSAPYIGYVMMDEEQAIEITFWYGTEKAADKTVDIISSIQ